MPKSSVIIHPASILQGVAYPVPIEDIGSAKIKTIIKRMSEALRNSADGIGIAAPQIGEPLQIFLASEEALKYDKAKEMEEDDRNQHHWEYYVFINPVITNYSRKKLREMEGCLSVPGKFGVVERSEKVTIEAYDEHGQKITRGASKLYARLMQHEVDHLSGHLFIEKAKDLVDIRKKKQLRMERLGGL